MDFGFVDPVLVEIGDTLTGIGMIASAVLGVTVVIKVHRWVRRSV